MLNYSRAHSRPDSLSPLLHALSSERRDAAAATAATLTPRMDVPSPSGRPTTPRKQLQGPRPPRLNVRPESHAIKKPSGAAAPAPAPGQAQAQGWREREPPPAGPPPRAPVIIYDASPKIIHAKPNEFMALVQRLTGPGSGAPPGEAPAPAPAQAQAQAQDYQMEELVPGPSSFLPPELLLSPSAAMSPAARLATIERSVRPMPATAPEYMDVADGEADDGGLSAILGSIRPGILSPLPSSLPPAAATGLFSPLPFDPSCISWLNELSPILRAASTGAASSGSGSGGGTSNGGASRAPPSYYSDPFVPSPRNLLATPTVPSPATCAEFFSNLPDF